MVQTCRAAGPPAEIMKFYRHLHAHPELSEQEVQTSRFLATQLRAVGFEVTESVGGHGIVAILRNGKGPCVLLRTDMDALPLTERTGLPYASSVMATNRTGERVGVMHACGHDMHMAAMLGAARSLAEQKNRWSGTLCIIGQPAEEIGAGAQAMIRDGLFTLIPKPDACIALHVAADLEAGRIGICPGYAMANVDSVDILVKGRGGHGAAPHQTIDPVVIGSQIVLALQTIASREVDPLDSVVVSVGSFHAGTKHNLIPDTAQLQLTVRTYSDAVRAQVLDAIRRIARATAEGAGVPEADLPEVIVKDEYTPALYNDPALSAQLFEVFARSFGEENVVKRRPEMIGEDFGRYGRTEDQIPICMFRVGTARTGPDGPVFQSLHASDYAPDAAPSLATAIRALTEAVLFLLPVDSPSEDRK